jgi:hypothetical protein
MAVTAVTFPQFQQKLATKAVNLTSDPFKVMLLSAYTFANTHATMADVVAAGTELTGTGYTAGGLALTSVTATTTGTVTKLSCANPAWTSATFSGVNYAVFYDAIGGTNATNFPVCYWNFGGAQSVSAGTFTLTINASGLYTVTSS